jgi:hypothetical protein
MILPSELPKVSYKKAEHLIHNGDMLSFKPRCVWWQPWYWFTWLIALRNKARVCHTGMAVWCNGNLLLVQMTSVQNRIQLLSEVVSRWPGKIIVSRPEKKYAEHWNVRKTIHEMVKITEKSYGWIRLTLLGITQTYTYGWLYPDISYSKRESTKWPPVCSESYSRAMRVGGFDVCPNKADCHTTPADLYESDRLTPLFVLV